MTLQYNVQWDTVLETSLSGLGSHLSLNALWSWSCLGLLDTRVSRAFKKTRQEDPHAASLMFDPPFSNATNKMHLF